MGSLMTLTSGLKTECLVVVPDNYLSNYFWWYSLSFFTRCLLLSDAGEKSNLLLRVLNRLQR